MREATRILQGRHDLLALAALDPARYPGLLESVAHGTESARYDVLAAFPQRSFQLDTDGRVRADDGTDLGTGFLDVLDEACRPNIPVERQDHVALPFRGGWFLYLGYELAAEIEPRLSLPMPEDGLPVAFAMRCPIVIVVDHAQDQTTLIAEPGFEHLLEEVARDLESSASWQPTPMNVLGVEEDPPQTFLDGVAATHDYLRAGDVFQVNLSREWRVKLAEPIPSASVYAALRLANPAPFAGLLQTPDWAIASSSPERLVQTRGAVVQTRPIAGTRPRLEGDDALARIRELVGHPKERAEHVMLIDLERNDLGRVCVPGSVVVDELMGVESYTHVHHIVSNVRGRLRADTTPGAVIRAVFPGGTITGCPKVRCMQIIAELERVPRGAYTGAFGYLDNNGDLDLNILIRTLTINASGIRLRAGAGIVVDSDADSELAETRAKARGLLRAFGLDG
jgi:anthranilate synthase component I